MDSLPLELLPPFLTGFDLLRLSHVNRRFFVELLEPDSEIWRARLPPTAVIAGSYKQAYCASVSMRFFGTTHAESRAAAIDVSQNFAIEDFECDPFAVELRFALLPSDERADSLVGGVLLGAQSEDWQDEFTPETFQAFIVVDQERNLRCSVLERKPVVARDLEFNRWYHLALTVSVDSDDNATQSVYLDGELVDRSDGRMAFGDLYYVQFGTGFMGVNSDGDMSGWYDFNGILDTARIFTTGITHDAVRKLACSQLPI